MKKKITLILTLILSLVSIFSVATFSASAEEAGWTVSVQDQAVVKGGEITINYTLKYGEDEVSALVGSSNGNISGAYMKKPYAEIKNGETVVGEGLLIKTADMEIGEKILTLTVYDTKGGVELAKTTFKLNVQKKDNTMTYIMIGLIVLVVGYMIWSSISNKKKQKKAQEEAGELKVGDKVMTIGGVCGFVKEINNKENTFILEVGEKSYVKFDKRAISEKQSSEPERKTQIDGKDVE